jgi:hypothetical protein
MASQAAIEAAAAEALDESEAESCDDEDREMANREIAEALAYYRAFKKKSARKKSVTSPHTFDRHKIPYKAIYQMTGKILFIF